MLLSTAAVFGQATKVKGRVVDAATGEGIPFAGVFFKGTTVGVSTDFDGYYSLETRDPGTSVIRAEIIGYDPEEKEARLGSFNELDFSLTVTDNRLTAATVKPDNSRMIRMLREIDRNRNRNDPERRASYKCDIYNKMELDLTNAEQTITNKHFKANFGFVFDYIDTSSVSGQPYLPIMISETMGRKFHSLQPTLDREVILASKISGVDAENHLTQFTGSLHMKVNMYDSFIDAFNVKVPSPISPNGDSYYNYYLIDSLQIEGRKTYYIRYHPKKLIPTPTFDGEMRIDSADCALVSLHAKLSKTSNVNWVRDLVIDMENQRVGDTTWFHKMDKLYVDFSVTQKDSSKLMSFVGTRQLYYSKPDFSTYTIEEVERTKNMDLVSVTDGSGEKSDEFWRENRPYALSEKEEKIYHMVDTIKSIPLYKGLYTVVSTIANGYLDLGKISLGPIFSTLSFNNLAGMKLRLGMRTSTEFSRKIRLGAWSSYGLLSNRYYGGASLEYMFSKNPTSKLSFSFSHDVVQLGKGASELSDDNLMSSLLTKVNSQKRSPVDKFTLKWEKEMGRCMNWTFALEGRNIHSNGNVPMMRADSSGFDHLASTQLHVRARFSWDETVTRGPFVKTYVFTKYPILTFDVMGAKAGLLSDYSFIRTEGTISYRLPLPPIGTSHIRINAGKIYGQVPYPLLKLHEGNGTYFLDNSAFSCMDFYEFASDTWATLFYEHNFHGLMLGVIPLVKKLNLREVVTVKAAWGKVSDKNMGIQGMPGCEKAVILFPKGMSSLEKPYVEMGVGITNIFRIFRVDCFWRTTHRYHVENGVKTMSDNLFSLMFGAELSF